MCDNCICLAFNGPLATKDIPAIGILLEEIAGYGGRHQVLFGLGPLLPTPYILIAGDVGGLGL
jgi:hypothetical protein